MKRLQITRASQKKALANTSHLPGETPLGARINPIIKIPRIIEIGWNLAPPTVTACTLGTMGLGAVIVGLLYTRGIIDDNLNLFWVFAISIGMASPLIFWALSNILYLDIVDKAYRDEHKAMYGKKPVEFLIADAKARLTKDGRCTSHENISETIRYYTGKRVSPTEIANIEATHRKSVAKSARSRRHGGRAQCLQR